MNRVISKLRQVNATTALRIAVRDGWTCHICRGGYDPDDPWEVDHLASVTGMSGSDEDENLGLTHQSCNRIKGSS